MIILLNFVFWQTEKGSFEKEYPSMLLAILSYDNKLVLRVTLPLRKIDQWAPA